jgi:DNA-binding transcriptional ArsR family regulator
MDAPDRLSPDPHVQTITDAKALSAMANPVRSRILDVLAVDGPATASTLAKRIDQAVGSASHHLKVLSQAGLVEEAPELVTDRRERWWRLVTLGQRWSRSDFTHDASALTAALAAESLVLQRQFERSRDWLATSTPDSEWGAAGFATQTWLRLSTAELAEFSAELIELTRRWQRRELPDDGAQRKDVFVFARGFPAQP